MKKGFSCLLALGMLSACLSGCVNDNQYVIIKGLVPGPLSECDATNETQTYLFGVGPCQWSEDAYLRLSAQIMNYVTGELPWSSAGGGSGTTFEGEVVNPGLIFLESIFVACERVDGDTSGCKGIDPAEIKVNGPITGSGGGLCVNFDLNSLSIDLSQWGGSVAVLSIYGTYHDSSLISGTTSRTYFTVDLTGKEGSTCVTFVDENADKDKDKEEEVVPEDPNAGKEQPDEGGGDGGDGGDGGSDGGSDGGDGGSGGGGDDGMEIHYP